MILALLLVALGAAPVPPESDRPAPAPCILRVRVLRGRVDLVRAGAGRVERLGRVSELVETTQGVYLELGGGSEAELAWSGTGSLRLHGPAALGWDPNTGVDRDSAASRLGPDLCYRSPAAILRPPDESEEPPIRFWTPEPAPAKRHDPYRREPIRIELLMGSVASGELEVRGPGMELLLAGAGWRLEVPPGALRLESRPAGRLRVVHHGGGPVRVRNLLLRAPGGWPVRIGPGDRVDLPPPPEDALRGGEDQLAADSPSPWM